MIKWDEFLKQKVARDIKVLYLNFLYLLEDLLKDGKIDQDQYNRLRKRVLDYGNNTARSIDEQLNQYDIKIKNKKAGK